MPIDNEDAFLGDYYYDRRPKAQYGPDECSACLVHRRNWKLYYCWCCRWFFHDGWCWDYHALKYVHFGKHRKNLRPVEFVPIQPANRRKRKAHEREQE